MNRRMTKEMIDALDVVVGFDPPETSGHSAVSSYDGDGVYIVVAYGRDGVRRMKAHVASLLEEVGRDQTVVDEEEVH